MTPEEKAKRILDALEQAERRISELEGEARVLIGCPCYCHEGWHEPHTDCRECVRGHATPTTIDHDHEWALWHEKWCAAVDTTQNWIERYEQAEREREKALDMVERLLTLHTDHCAMGHRETETEREAYLLLREVER